MIRHTLKILQQIFCIHWRNCPAKTDLFKVNHRKTWKRCEICSRLITKTLKRRRWQHSCVFIVNFKHILHFPLVLRLLAIRKSVLSGCAFFKNLYTCKLGEISVFCAVIFKGIPANIDLFKVNNRNSRKRCEICSQLTIKTSERFWCFYIVC